MIVLFTDFGPAGPYVGQMKAVLHGLAPEVAVIDLLSDAPACDPRAGACLLAAYAGDFPAGAVFLCVVDPGVGGDRAAVALRADGRWFVGPDNGLFNVVALRAHALEWWDITWRPPRLSATFHGRDLFAPVAARIARGETPPGERRDAEARIDRGQGPDYARVVYLDHFGNAITGLRAEDADPHRRLEAGGRTLSAARTYSDVAPGAAFWYANANGLVEIAVNRGSAAASLGLKVGDPVAWERTGLRTKD
ncbi:MAG: SAM-dependent chlorinase/fluorinase [Gammaproteobacteria bacterium]|nr:SAM-dependent chlorinase/fluorinase [Gammaproteobacteria bacterium]